MKISSGSGIEFCGTSDFAVTATTSILDTAASKEEKSKLHDVKGKEKEKEKERKDSVPLEGLSLREALSVAKEQQK